jgi:hypothetical protein
VPGHRGQLRGLYGSDLFSSIWPAPQEGGVAGCDPAPLPCRLVDQNCPEIRGFRHHGELAIRRWPRLATLPQPGFFETAHLAPHISTVAGFFPVVVGMPAACRKMRGPADIIEL